MKKFLKELIGFIVLILIIAAIIAETPITNEFIIYKTRNTSYEKIAWDLNIIDKHPDRLRESIIFLGPSLAQGDLDDSLLDAHGIKALNMGVNHNGNEIELWFLMKIAQYEPKSVYLHLSKETHVNLHPMTPLLFSPHLLIRSGQSFNVPFMMFFFKRISYVIEYFFWLTYSKEAYDNPKISDFGIRYEKGSVQADEFDALKSDQIEKLFESPCLQLNQFKFTSEKKLSGLGVNSKHLLRLVKHYTKNINFFFNAYSQQQFVAESFKLGEKYNVPIVELYLPVLVDSKVDLEFSQQFYAPRNTMKVASLKNFSFLNKAEYWFDMNHLSKSGAILFTQKLVDQGMFEQAKND